MPRDSESITTLLGAFDIRVLSKLPESRNEIFFVISTVIFLGYPPGMTTKYNVDLTKKSFISRRSRRFERTLLLKKLKMRLRNHTETIMMKQVRKEFGERLTVIYVNRTILNQGPLNTLSFWLSGPENERKRHVFTMQSRLF